MDINEPDNINLMTLEYNDQLQTHQEFLLFEKKRILPKCKNSVGLFLTFLFIVIPTITFYMMYIFL